MCGNGAEERKSKAYGSNPAGALDAVHYC
jgi:hypothetical protein